MSTYKSNKQSITAALVVISLISTAILALNTPTTYNIYAQVKGGRTEGLAAASPTSATEPKQTQSQNTSSQSPPPATQSLPSSTATPPRQQPSSRAATTAPLFRYPSLVVATHVNNTNGGKGRPDNFTQVVTNTYRTSDGYAIAFHLLRGSDLGVTINLRPGTFAVTDQGNSTAPLNRSYNSTYSGDCTGIRSAAAGGKTLGLGLIRLDDAKSCVVTKTFVK